MSFISRDFLTPARYSWNSASALYQRFDRVWGKEWVDGIYVYSKKLYWYTGSVRNDKPFNRFINALGMEKSQLANNSFSHIDSCWFYLNHQKYNYVAKEKTAIVADLNDAFNIDDEFEVSITYGGGSKRYVDGHWQYSTTDGKWFTDLSNIRTILDSNPIKYYANAEIAPAGVMYPMTKSPVLSLAVRVVNAQTRTFSSTPVAQTFASGTLLQNLALLDNGSMFQRVGPVYSESVSTEKITSGSVTFKYSFKYRYKVVAEATEASYVVNQIDLVSNKMQSAMQIKNGTLAAKTNTALDTNIKKAIVSMNNAESVGIFYNGYLRVDAVSTMPRLEFQKMIAKTIDSDFKQEEAKWYEDFFAVVIIVIAIAVAFASWGGASSFTMALKSLAVALGNASMVLSVGLMIYVSAFPAATDKIKMISGVAQIVGMAAMIAAVFAAIATSYNQYAMNAGQQAAQNGATQQAAAVIAENYGLMDYLADFMKDWITQKIDAVTQLFTPSATGNYLPDISKITLNDVSGWLDNMNDSLNMYFKFFGDRPQNTTPVDADQAQKEDGVSNYYAAVSMIDEKDALYKMDMLKNNSFGGQMTENYLTKLY